MFDPTIFENLKVAFENHVYDLDNIEEEVIVTNRIDRMDFAVMEREFRIEFQKLDQPQVKAEIMLMASLQDLANEILEKVGTDPGCTLILRFQKDINNVKEQCRKIDQVLHTIWENEVELSQTLSFLYGQEHSQYKNIIEAKFKHSINEENMNEISDFLYYVLHTVDVLAEI